MTRRLILALGFVLTAVLSTGAAMADDAAPGVGIGHDDGYQWVCVGTHNSSGSHPYCIQVWYPL